MDWLDIVWVGLVATAVMTAMMYVAPMMGMPKMDIAQMLGSMFLPQGSTAFAVGMMMHFMMGVILTVPYALVWELTDLDVTSWSGLFLGLAHWMVALVMMPVIMTMHKEVRAGRMPSMLKSGGMMAAAGLVMGHLVFGLIIGLLYTPA